MAIVRGHMRRTKRGATSVRQHKRKESFKVGDHIRIISGEHKGTLGTIISRSMTLGKYGSAIRSDSGGMLITIYEKDMRKESLKGAIPYDDMNIRGKTHIWYDKLSDADKKFLFIKSNKPIPKSIEWDDLTEREISWLTGFWEANIM